MGFMGLAHTVEVDGASDLKYSILSAFQNRIDEELLDEGDINNPPGIINILLVFKEEPNLIRYLSPVLLGRIDLCARRINLDQWGKKEVDQIKDLIRRWNENPTVKKYLVTGFVR